MNFKTLGQADTKRKEVYFEKSFETPFDKSFVTLFKSFCEGVNPFDTGTE